MENAGKHVSMTKESMSNRHGQHAAPTVGAPSSVREADESIQKIVDQVRPEIEEQLSASFTKFEATHVSTQVVAGTMHFIRILTSRTFPDDALDVKVFQPLPYTGLPPQLQHLRRVHANDPLETNY